MSNNEQQNKLEKLTLALQNLPLPCHFVILNDTKKFPGWNRVQLMCITPNVEWTGTQWECNYDFGPAFEKVLYASAGYKTETERQQQYSVAYKKYWEFQKEYPETEDEESVSD